MSDANPRKSTLQAIADRHGLSYSTVYREARAGRLVARKCGERTLVTEQDEKAWLDAMPKALQSAESVAA